VTKIKIKAYTPTERVPPGKPNNGGSQASPLKQQAPVQQPVQKEKGLFSKCIDIIRSDIREVIHGEEIKMPESKESWEDWKGEL
jgi:hypothetical protein